VWRRIKIPRQIQNVWQFKHAYRILRRRCSKALNRSLTPRQLTDWIERPSGDSHTTEPDARDRTLIRFNQEIGFIDPAFKRPSSEVRWDLFATSMRGQPNSPC